MEPFGEERADLRAGIIAATIANSAPNSRGGFKAADFMPAFGEPKRQSVQEMQAILSLASRQGAAAKTAAEKQKPGKKDRTK